MHLILFPLRTEQRDRLTLSEGLCLVAEGDARHKKALSFFYISSFLNICSTLDSFDSFLLSLPLPQT